MSEKWDNLEYDGRRLARLIRFLETKMNHVKASDPDAIVRYASCIGLLISKKIELIKTHTMSERLDKIEAFADVFNKDKESVRRAMEISDEQKRRGR